MSGHTPGEWSIDPNNGDIVAGPVNVAILYVTRPEDKRLMASAPCLLEALREVVAKFDASDDAGVRNTPLGIMKARTAIARATGEVL